MTSIPGRKGTVHAATSDDDEADEFETELRPLVGEAVRLATGMLLSAVEAEDAVQEACLRAWRRRTNRRPGSPLRPWFLAIVANECRELRQSPWRSVLRLSDLSAMTTVLPADPGPGLDLRRALRRLPYRMRLVLVLRYYMDQPYDTIASVSGCSVNAAKALVYRATSRLEKALRDPEATQ